jgi:hypothetical protein
MTEVLFILVTIFVAYIIYVVVNTQKATTIAHSPVSQEKPEKPVAVVKQSAPRPVTQKKEVPEIKPVAAAATKSEPIVSPRDAGKKGLKDPKTGEVATRYSNYRFTKRWIKEALVAEKLLDKVYKNDELNADIEAKIKSAILKLEAIKKYRV